MKKLVFVALAFALTLPLAADTPERDVLLTQTGVVYTVENEDSADTNSHQLVLTVQANGSSIRSVVPDSAMQGLRSAPALAFDSESQTLFVFWLRMPNMLSSEVVVTGYRNGRWQKATTIDSSVFSFRSNVRIAVRHRVAKSDPEVGDVSALVVHATWWEQTSTGERARYALLTIENGAVANVELHNLEDLMPVDVNSNFSPTSSADLNLELLRRPVILDTLSPNSVNIIFGDLRTNSLNRATIRPIVAEGRIHIPIGRTDGGVRLGAPRAFSTEWSGKAAGMIGGSDDGTLLLYNVMPTSVSFLMYSGGEWSKATSVPLNDKLSADSAVGALSRMLSQ